MRPNYHDLLPVSGLSGVPLYTLKGVLAKIKWHRMYYNQTMN